MEGHTCLTGRDVGLPDKSGSGPTRLGRKEGAGLPGRSQRGRKMGGLSILNHRHGGVTLLHRTHEVGEVSGRRVSKVGGKWLLPGSGDLSMQIAEKWQLPPFRLGMCTTEEPLVEFRSSRHPNPRSHVRPRSHEGPQRCSMRDGEKWRIPSHNPQAESGGL